MWDWVVEGGSKQLRMIVQESLSGKTHSGECKVEVVRSPTISENKTLATYGCGSTN